MIHWNKKLTIGLVLALIMALGVVMLVLADTIQTDGDVVSPAMETTINLGTVTAGTTITSKISFQLSCDGNKHVDNGQVVNLNYNAVSSTIPAGGALTASNATIGAIPDAWPEDGTNSCTGLSPINDNGDSTVTITAPSTGGTYSFVVVYSIALSPSGGNDPASVTGAAPTVIYNLTVPTVVQDTTPPTIGDNADIVLEATGPSGAVATFSNPAASDLVDTSVDVVCAPTSGSTFALGHTKVTCTATDDSGNSAQSDFDVLVQDTTPPALTLPADITAEATGPSGATVTFTATASDLVDGLVDVTCTPASGSTFALGTISVSCTASDTTENAVSGSFNVTVQDTTAPLIAAHADVTAEATSAAGALVSYSAPTTSDAVDGAGLANCAPDSGSQFALGDTTVTCNATDAHGNKATPNTFVVSVVDTTPPVIASHSDVTAEATSSAGALVSFTAPATSDAVDGVGTATCAPASGSQFGLGNTNVTCNATDAHGNTATSTTFVVHVVDTTPPVIAAHSDETAEATSSAGAVVNYIAPATLDIVDGAGTATCVPASGSQFAIGFTTVTCTATDHAGNQAAPITFKIRVTVKLYGFYAPVDMNGVYNTVKNGSTVPLKFEIFAGTTELTDVGFVMSLTYAQTTCDANATTDDIETIATGGTSLRYDTTGGQFVYNWKTPATAGKCYRVTMTTQDGSSLVAFFKLK